MNWREDECFDPGMFGLLDNPGVLRMDFDDYPETIYTLEVSEIDDPDGEDDTDVDMLIDPERNTPTKTSSMDHFEYVRNRFETDLPDYEEALEQNGINPQPRDRLDDHVRVLRFEGLYFSIYIIG